MPKMTNDVKNDLFIIDVDNNNCKCIHSRPYIERCWQPSPLGKWLSCDASHAIRAIECRMVCRVKLRFSGKV